MEIALFFPLFFGLLVSSSLSNSLLLSLSRCASTPLLLAASAARAAPLLLLCAWPLLRTRRGGGRMSPLRAALATYVI